jgi:hypothetical protein
LIKAALFSVKSTRCPQIGTGANHRWPRLSRPRPVAPAFHRSHQRFYGQLIEDPAVILTCPDFLPSISKEAGAAIFFATTQLTTYLTETIVDAYHHYAQY